MLRDRSVNVDDYQRRGQLTVVGGDSTGAATLSKLGAMFQKAVDDGAQVIRLLGNIGWGKKGWPEEDDILDFEHQVTGAAKAFPAVIVCMYDVNTLSGRVIVQGGLATHPHRRLRQRDACECLSPAGSTGVLGAGGDTSAVRTP